MPNLTYAAVLALWPIAPAVCAIALILLVLRPVLIQLIQSAERIYIARLGHPEPVRPPPRAPPLTRKAPQLTAQDRPDTQ